MTFWDGSRWVDDRPSRHASPPAKHRTRDWLATIPILLLIPMLIVPYLPTLAGSPTLTVDGATVPTGRVDVVGERFASRTWIQLLWDGSPSGMPSVRTNGDARFAAKVTIPANSKLGNHVLSAVPGKPDGSRKGPSTSVDPLAELTVVVTDEPPPSDPTPEPTPEPTPKATPAATSAATSPPTARPTPTADPTSTPAPTATPGPTATPTATPTPTAVPTSTPTEPPPSGAGGLHGMRIGGDTLANTQIGGVNARGYNAALSGRFRAGTSSKLESVRIYIIANGDTGYSHGTGGRIEATLRPDDGTSNHGPSGTVLASATFASGNPSTIGKLPLITFNTPASVVAGRLYHIVFRNIDPSPSTNYISINALYTWQPVTPRQPKYSDVDWGQMVDQGSGWTQRAGYTHIMGITYGNGVGEGMGYMGAWQQVQPAISGANRVREQFSVLGGDLLVSSVSVRVKRDSTSTGTSPLTVRLEDSTGRLIEEGTIPYSTFPVGDQVDGSTNRNSWGTVVFSGSHILESGSTYRIVLSARSDTVYRAMPLQKGSAYGFPAASYYTGGYGQKSSDSGATWSGFSQPGGSTNRTDADLQFHLGS